MHTPPSRPDPLASTPPAFDSSSKTLRAKIPATGRSRRSERGVSLVEIMVALGVLAFLSVSVIGITFQIRSTAEQAVYQNTALTLAQGYMEQIRHMDYSKLKAAAQGAGSLPLNKIAGPAFNLAPSTYTTERVYLDQTAGGANIQPMDFHFQVLVTSLETVTSGTSNPAAGVEVTIDYDVTYNYGVTRTTHAMLRSVRSSVPLY